MATEIERKFLIANNDWQEHVDDEIHIIQGYIGSNEKSSIRIRVDGTSANLNIKSRTLGIERSEYDYAIPVDDAQEILHSLCDKPLLEKIRYHVIFEQHKWEIDVFKGENEGLIVAEIELKSADESFTMPGWIGREVSDDPRYYNVCLVDHPFKNW